MKLRTGDTVVIISGREKGKTGKVLRVFHDISRLVVEGVNMRTRHVKKTHERPGNILRYEASLHASTVMVVDPKTAKRTRIGMLCGEQGHQRITKKSGTVLERRKPAEKGKREKKAEQMSMGEEQRKTAVPTREPFWKRAFRGTSSVPEGQGEGRDRQEEVDRSSSVGSVRRSRESS